MQFEEILTRRHSVRDFLPDPVPMSVITECVHQAQTAPSWVNAQEWKVYVATGETLERIRKTYIEKATAGIQGYTDVAVAHRENWSKAAQANMEQLGAMLGEQNLGEAMGAVQVPLFNAPAVAYLTMPRTASGWAMLDMGGFYQTFMLALTNAGYGSIPAYGLVKYPDVLRDLLPIGEDEQIVVGVAFGKPSSAPINSFRTTRAELGDVLVCKA